MTLSEKRNHLNRDAHPAQRHARRLAWLIEMARRRPLMPAALRTETHRVPGCLARLWLVPDFRDGRCYFTAESDSLIVKSIAGLLCDLYSGHAPEEIRAQDPDFLGQLGLHQQSPQTAAMPFRAFGRAFGRTPKLTRRRRRRPGRTTNPDGGGCRARSRKSPHGDQARNLLPNAT